MQRDANELDREIERLNRRHADLVYEIRRLRERDAYLGIPTRRRELDDTERQLGILLDRRRAVQP